MAINLVGRANSMFTILSFTFNDLIPLIHKNLFYLFIYPGPKGFFQKLYREGQWTPCEVGLKDLKLCMKLKRMPHDEAKVCGILKRLMYNVHGTCI